MEFPERQLAVEVQRDEEVFTSPFDAGRFGHGGTVANHSSKAKPRFLRFGLPETEKPGQLNEPIMGKIYTIRIEENDLGQLLDGLRSRSESWHNTAEYFESGYNQCEDFVIEECNDVGEARAIASHYDRIITTLEREIKAQGGSS